MCRFIDHLPGTAARIRTETREQREHRLLYSNSQDHDPKYIGQALFVNLGVDKFRYFATEDLYPPTSGYPIQPGQDIGCRIDYSGQLHLDRIAFKAHMQHVKLYYDRKLERGDPFSAWMLVFKHMIGIANLKTYTILFKPEKDAERVKKSEEIQIKAVVLFKILATYGRYRKTDAEIRSGWKYACQHPGEEDLVLQFEMVLSRIWGGMIRSVPGRLEFIRNKVDGDRRIVDFREERLLRAQLNAGDPDAGYV